eukprot:scaffold36689_cov199-Amphora_coffeaeformis.AAC.1
MAELQSEQEVLSELPIAKNHISLAHNRELRTKGKGKSSIAADCIPLYPTIAPFPTASPAKGKGRVKVYSPGTATSSKGKGSSSEAPSFFCSNAPSFLPTTSLAPSIQPSDAPSSRPTTSLAPSIQPSSSTAPTSSFEPSSSLPPSGQPSVVSSSVPTCGGKGKGRLGYSSCSMSMRSPR